MLCEYGCGMDESTEQAKEYYLSALKDNHPNREGFMLAAGADLGMGRILSLEIEKEKAAGHLEAAIAGGEPAIRREAEVWLKETERK